MKKMAPFLIPVVLFAAGLFIGYRLFYVKQNNTPVSSTQSNDKTFNPFLAAREKLKDSKDQRYSPYDLQGTLLSIHNHQFTASNLPLEVRLNIYKEQVAYFERVRAVLTEYGLRLNAVVESQIPITSYDSIPQLPEIYSFLVTEEEVLKIYNDNLDKFPKDMSREEILININTQLLTERLIRRFKTDALALEKEKKLKVFEDAPRIPAGALPMDSFFKLGNAEGDIQILMVGNYFCEECFAYDKQFVEIFSNYGERVNFHFFPHFTNLMEGPGIFARAGYCLYKQSVNTFWQYHFLMTQNHQDYSKRFNKETNPDQIYHYINEKIASLEFNKDTFNQCFSENNADTMTELHRLSRIIELIGLGQFPTIVLNRRKLPLTAAENLDVIIEEFL